MSQAQLESDEIVSDSVESEESSSENESTTASQALSTLLLVASPRAKRSKKLPSKFTFTDDERQQQAEKDAAKRVTATKIVPPIVASSTLSASRVKRGKKRAAPEKFNKINKADKTDKTNKINNHTHDLQEQAASTMSLYSKEASNELGSCSEESDTGVMSIVSKPDPPKTSENDVVKMKKKKIERLTERQISLQIGKVPEDVLEQYNVASVLVAMLENQKMIIAKINDIEAALVKLALANGTEAIGSNESGINLPLEDLSAQKAAENLFANKIDSRVAMIHRLSLLGGSKPEESVRIIMRKLMSTELRRCYNAQKAINGKLAFKDTPCYGIVVDSLRKRHNNLCEDKILQYVGDVFTRSKDENGGRAYRKEIAQKKKELTRQAEEAIAAEKNRLVALADK